MNLNDLLVRQDLDPATILVLRHSPPERELRRVLPWLAAERHDVFNAFQQTQQPRLQQAMARLNGHGHLLSLIGNEPGQAKFVGLYAIRDAKPITRDEFWRIPAYRELREYGMEGWSEADNHREVLWFDLSPTEFYADWKGRLIVGWPPPERSWWRRAHRNEFPVHALLRDSSLDAEMPEWDRLDLTWNELGVLPTPWKTVLSQWRAIYYIFDTSDGKGYVGSAAGAENLLGRWKSYAHDGHGGNRLLRPRDPRNFRFSILQRVSPDLERDEVVRLEASWKERLHTRAPVGLNDN